MSEGEPVWSMRRAAIIGAGAMGSTLSAILGQTIPVVLICRNPDRAAQIIRYGVSTEGAIRAQARPVIVRDLRGLLDAGGADVVFVATKTTAIDRVAEELAPILPALRSEHGEPYIVSFQNGIAPGQRLTELLDNDRVLRIVLNLGATLDESGRMVRVGLNEPPHAIGGPDPRHRAACESIGQTLTRGGLETVYDPDIELAVWQKAIVNAAANPVSALVNSTVGQAMDSPARVIVEALLDEGIAVARADGLDLAPDFKRRAIELLEHARTVVPSMVEDIRGGRESEVGQLNRQIIEHARRSGVKAPTHEIIDALIETFDWKIYERRARTADSPRSSDS